MLLIPDTCVIELLNLDIDTFGKLTLQSTKFLHRFLECESCCSSVLQREVHSSGKLTLRVALWRKSVIVSSFPKVSMSKRTLVQRCNVFLADDGLIDEADLREVMKACMVENGMHFDEKEVSDLANALFDDAVKVRVIIFTY